jgi:L,D-peptidoglycan transpeptidase YkuD (ErfK/YbiS/YcfS/YnhG family)
VACRKEKNETLIGWVGSFVVSRSTIGVKASTAGAYDDDGETPLIIMAITNGYYHAALAAKKPTITMIMTEIMKDMETTTSIVYKNMRLPIMLITTKRTM